MRMRGLLWTAGIMSMIVIAGCRPEEQRRPIEFQKGTYIGPPDEALTDEQRKELRQRAESGH